MITEQTNKETYQRNLEPVSRYTVAIPCDKFPETGDISEKKLLIICTLFNN